MNNKTIFEMSTRLECRTCLGEFYNSDVVSVEEIIVDQKNVSEAIGEIASVEVRTNDVLPKHVCQICFRLLESAVTFRKQIILSHIELKKRYHSELTDPLFINCGQPTTPSTPKLHWSKEVDGCQKVQENVESEILPNEIKENIEGFKFEEKEYNNTWKKSPDFGDSSNDWNGINEENYSSDVISDDKPIKKSFSKTTSKKSFTQRIINRRKRPPLRKSLRKISESSSDGSDSDVPLEELRREIKDLGKQTDPKVRKKEDKRDNGEGPRLCPICGKLFKAKQNFNSHMTTVHRKKTEKPDKVSCLCPDCGRVITGTRQNFVAHRRYHHSDKAQVKKRFTCDVCPRKFYREKNLIIHQRMHKGEKGYVCELCPDKSYTQIGGLILHRRKVHLKKPTCTCNYCGKQFYEKHYLETHIRQWHTGERPFSCEICGKAFSCNGTLLRHRKDSHGEKKPCPKCGKMYTEGELRKHLKRHKIREEGIKRKKYTCEYCGTEMNFTSRKRHLLKQHGIMLRGRGEHAERVPITRADAM